MPINQWPHHIVFGKEKIMSGDEYKLIVDVNEPPDLSNERREAIHEEAASTQREAYELNRRKHDLRAWVRKFKTGDIVMVKIHKHSNAGDKYTQKLAPI